jgi:metal transporter CNNM
VSSISAPSPVALDDAYAMMPSSLRAPACVVPLRSNGLLTGRSIVIGLARVLFMGVSTAIAAPLHTLDHLHDDVPEAEGADLWVLYVASLILVLSGGAFAGLTIA